MKTVKLILTLLFGAFMIFSGINHFLKPDMYLPFIPDFLPRALIIYLSGVVEIVLGLGVFIPRFRYLSALRNSVVNAALFTTPHSRCVQG